MLGGPKFYTDRHTETILCFLCVKSKTMGGSPGEFSEELVTQERRKKGWRMNCDVGESMEVLENELWRR